MVVSIYETKQSISDEIYSIDGPKYLIGINKELKLLSYMFNIRKMRKQ